MKIDLTYGRQDRYFVAIKQGNMPAIDEGIRREEIDLNCKYSQKGKVVQESLIHAAIRLNQPLMLEKLISLPTFISAIHLKEFACYFDANHKIPVPFTPMELAQMLSSQACIQILEQAENK